MSTTSSIMTATQARKLKLAELQAYATSVDISTTETQGEDTYPKKKNFLLKEVLAYLKKNRRKNTNEVKIEDRHLDIKNDKTIKSKSQKMRLLHDEGLSMTTISVLLDAHYSFVHSTITSYKLKKQLATVTSNENIVLPKAKKKAPAKKATKKVAKKQTA